MHSRIFQITKEPVTFAIAEDDYADHWFTREIADYVMEDKNPEASLEWLGKHSGLSVDATAKTVTVTSKEAFFKDAFAMFSKAVAELSTITIEQFAYANRDVADAVYYLKQAYDDKFAFYVEDCGEYAGLITLDEWVRNVAMEGRAYYIGGSLDYHF